MMMGGGMAGGHSSAGGPPDVMGMWAIAFSSSKIAK
jgi:hypothetical protein